MKIPEFAEGTLSDFLEQRIDALEDFILGRFGTEDDAYIHEILDVRSLYRKSIEDMDEAVRVDQVEYEDEDGQVIGQMDVYDMLEDEDDE